MQPNSPICGITYEHAGHITPSRVTCPGLPIPDRSIYSWPGVLALTVVGLVILFGTLIFR